MKYISFFISPLMLFILLMTSQTYAAEQERSSWLRQKVQERIEEKKDVPDDQFDGLESGGKSCTEKDKSVKKITNSILGRNMWGPEADIEDIPYGSHALETLDVFYSKKALKNQLAPIIFMVHGGGWCIGNKDIGSVIQEKVKRWTPKGFIFISINYPMILDNRMAKDQAFHVAKALAYVQSHAKEWDGDPKRIILMGHSAGAHLVSLVNASSTIRNNARAKAVLGTVSLDSGAIDVPTQMPKTIHSLKTVYKEAFGTSEEEWVAASPYHQLDSNAAPWLGVCSLRRSDDPCAQAKAYAEKSRTLNIRASVLPQRKSHGAINKELGKNNQYTQDVETFMASLDPIVKTLLKK